MSICTLISPQTIAQIAKYCAQSVQSFLVSLRMECAHLLSLKTLYKFLRRLDGSYTYFVFKDLNTFLKIKLKIISSNTYNLITSAASAHDLSAIL